MAPRSNLVTAQCADNSHKVVVMATGRITGLTGSVPPSGAGSAVPSTLAQALPRLAQETELQKMLADEKMRSEQHKTNYQTLKAEHTRLQDEYVQLQNELRNTIEETKVVQDKYKSVLEQTRKELLAKHAELEELKVQVMTPQRMEMVKLQVSEEVEKPFRDKFQKLDEEVEKYRAEYNKLKYEYSFLKSEYEHEKEEHKRVIEEMKLRNEAEVANLRKERESIISRQQTDTSTDSSRVRTLQRENAQLHLKVKGLLTELEEIRAQRENLGLQHDHVARLQSKQLVENAANVRALETEKESLKLQCDNLQKELAATSDLHNQLTSRVHELEKENLVWKNRAEETNHKSKVELTNVKMEMLKERGDLERERDRLRNEIEDLKSQLDVAKHSIDAQANALIEKEREAVKRVQGAREEEWQKLHKIENEKLELETKLQEIERRKIDEEAHKHAEKEKVEERLKQASDAKEAAEKEAIVYKTKLQNQETLMEQVDRERSENSDLKNRLHRVEAQYQAYLNTEQEFSDMNHKLQNQVDMLNDELKRAKDEIHKGKDLNDRVLTQHRAAWMDEKGNLQKRIDELEAELKILHEKTNQMTVAQRKRKKQYTKLTTSLKEKVSLLRAQVEELQIERDALQKSVPPDTHNQIKKQLKDLLRRHREFRTVMTSGVGAVNFGDVSFASATGPNPYEGSFGPLNAFEYEKQFEKDFAMLKERLDLLDDNQRAQLDDLRTVSNVGAIKHQDTEEEVEKDDFQEKENEPM